MARAKPAAAVSLSASLYWFRLRSTLPETGPCNEAKNRPCSVSQETQTPFVAQCAKRKGLRDTCPKTTNPLKVWTGILATN
jgi:hypothetical protein